MVPIRGGGDSISAEHTRVISHERHRAAGQGGRNFVDAIPISQTNLGPDRATLLLIAPISFPSIAEVRANHSRFGRRLHSIIRPTARVVATKVGCWTFGMRLRN
jgi:hypothetical protein